MEILSQINHKKVIRLYYNFLEKSLHIKFEDNIDISFIECALVIDTGIVGHCISFVSNSGTLGMTFELKRMKEDPDDYNSIVLSRDINDLENKNELLVSFKFMKINLSDIIS